MPPAAIGNTRRPCAADLQQRAHALFVGTGFVRAASLVDCNNHLWTIMASMSDAIELTKVERMELERRAASRTGRAEDARRARLLLLLAEGHTWVEACE